MIKLIFGDNLYQSWQEYNSELKKATQDISTQIIKVEGDDIKDLQSLFAKSEMNSFFETKKVLFVKRFFKNRSKNLKEKAAEFLEKNKDLDIIFWEDGSADKRIKLYKVIKKIGEVIECKPLSQALLSRWVAAEFKKNDMQISSDIVRYMLDSHSLNQQLLYKSIQKITLYLSSIGKVKVSLDDVKLMTSHSREESIWEFVDSIASRDHKKALVLMENIIREDSDYPYVFAMLLRQIKLLFLASKYSDMNLQDLASFLKMNSFALRKIHNVARNFEHIKLSESYDKLINLDFKVKQGIINPKLGLDLFILSFR